MVSDLKIEAAIKAGEKNKQTWELVRNWCAHVSIEKFGGVGLLEAQTRLPIGHHSLKCPHAAAGGIASWDLTDAALDFYDRNCVGCKFRKPVGIPNLSTLVSEREARRESQRLEEQRAEQAAAERFSVRERARQDIRLHLNAVAATTLDQISKLDSDRSKDAPLKLVRTAELAPESFTPAIIEHLFALVDSNEPSLVEPALMALAQLPVNKGRLCNAALRCLHGYSAWRAAAKIVQDHGAAADITLIAAALPVLVRLADPDPYPFVYERRTPMELPLQNIYRFHAAAVQAGLKALLERTDANSIRVAVSGLLLLLGKDASLAEFMTCELIAKLGRAKWLVQGTEEEISDTLRDIRELVGAAFQARPEAVDSLVSEYLVGATPEGRVELHKIYEEVLGRARRTTKDTELTDAHRLAFRRLVVAATETVDQRYSEAVGNFHGDPYELTPIVVEEIDLLLGSAALLSERLVEEADEKINQNDMIDALERMGRRSRLSSLEHAFVHWACVAAGKSGPAAIQKVLGFLRGLPESSERLRGKIIGNFDDLMRTTEGLALCLPDFYSALVGSSQLVRSYAATALGEMRGASLQNMPALVFEAFTASLNDPYLIVHQAAVRALQRFSLPDQCASSAQRAISNIITYYAKARTHDGFLVTAIELYAHRYAKAEQLAGDLGTILLEILLKLPPNVVAQEARFALQVFSEHPLYPRLLLRMIGDEGAMSTYHEDLLEQIQRLPRPAMYAERANVVAIGTKLSTSYPYAVVAFVEALTAAGAWSEAAEFSSAVHQKIADTTWNRVTRHHAALLSIACAYEAAIAAGRLSELRELHDQWSATCTEIERDHEANKGKRDPLYGLPRAD